MSVTPEALLKVLAERPVLWVGAGLSVAAGYPSTWKLIEAARAKAFPGHIADALTDFTRIFDAFVKAYGGGELDHLMQAQFREPREPTPTHHALARLAGAGAFRAIVTTNYDPLLELALSAAKVPHVLQVIERNGHIADSGDVPLLKIHGSFDDWRSLVLSSRSYDAFEDRYGFLMAQLRTLLQQHRVLFLGCSMQDRRVLDWLAGLDQDWAERLRLWHPVMLRDEWEVALRAGPALGRAKMLPLFIADHAELPRVFTSVAQRLAPSGLTIEVQVGPAGWQARMDGCPDWTITDPTAAGPDGRSRLGEAIRELRALDHQALPTDERGQLSPAVAGAAAALHVRAARVGEELTAGLLSDQARARLAAAVAKGKAGDPHLLLVRVAPAESTEACRALADHALALPWELLRVDDDFPVRSGALDVAREAVVEGLPGLPEPEAPLTVVAAVAAPVDAGALDYEDEAYRVWQALGAHPERLRLTDRGTLDDLVAAMEENAPPVLHFTGHGLPGALLFEDDAALSHLVPVPALVERLRAVGHLPRLVFLAACHGASLARAAAAPPGSREGRMADEAAFAAAPSTAATLHREGFAQVVAYFGPVGDAQSTRLEAAFYAALVEGHTAREAVRRARAVAAEPHGPNGAHTHVYPLGWAQLALYHRGRDVPTALRSARGQADVYATARRRHAEHLSATTGGVARLAHGFVGRRGPRAKLIRRWHEGGRLAVVAGLGGLGKTALCAEVLSVLARRQGGVPLLAFDGRAARDAENPVQVLWRELAAFRPATPGWDQAAWEAKLGRLQEGGFTGAALAAAVHYAERACGGLLVYLDDAESLQVLLGDGDGALGRWKDPRLDDLWRALASAAATGGRLGLVASTRYVPDGVSDEAVVHLEPMRKVDLLRLLRWWPTLGRVPAATLDWLADRIDGHPRTVESLEELARLRAQHLAAERVGPGAAYDGRDWRGEVLEPALPEAAAKVDADLLLPRLWDALPEDAREHLGRCTVLRAAVPWGAIVALGTADTAVHLTRVGLLSPDPVMTQAAPWWAPHRLVIEGVAPRWGGDARAAHGTVGRWLAGQFGETPNAHTAMRAVEHLTAAGDGDAAWPVAHRLVLWLRDTGRYREGLDWVERVLSAHPSGERLGLALTFQAQMAGLLSAPLPDAEERLRRAVKLVTVSDVPFVLDEFAKILIRQARFGEAAKVLRESVAAATEHRGTDQHSSVATSLHNLGVVLQAQGDLAGARHHLERSLRIKEVVFGNAPHPEVATSLQELGALLQAQGDLAGARHHLERSLRILEVVFGTDPHASVAASLHALGGVLQAQGDLAGARHYLEFSLHINEVVFGTDPHPEVAASLHALGRVLGAQGDLAGARQHLERSLRIKKVVFGTDQHPEVAASLHSLAMVFWEEGEQVAAVAGLERVLEIEQHVYGTPDHPSSAQTEEMLGAMLVKLGRPAEGLPRLLHALEVYRRFLGETHPDTRRLAQKLGGGGQRPWEPALSEGLATLRSGDAVGAVAPLRAAEAAAASAGAPGPEASARGFLAQALLDLGRPAEARPEAERAVEIARAVGQADAVAHFEGLLAMLLVDT